MTAQRIHDDCSGLVACHSCDLLHVKTAGTSYLEALRTIASCEPELFREILDFSTSLYEHERRTYHVSAVLDRVPPMLWAFVGSVRLILPVELLARLDDVPQQAKHSPRHIRMPDDVVLHVQQFVFGITGNAHEDPVGVGDTALEIGLGDDEIAISKKDVDLDGFGINLGIVFRF